MMDDMIPTNIAIIMVNSYYLVLVNYIRVNYGVMPHSYPSIIVTRGY